MGLIGGGDGPIATYPLVQSAWRLGIVALPKSEGHCTTLFLDVKWCLSGALSEV